MSQSPLYLGHDTLQQIWRTKVEPIVNSKNQAKREEGRLRVWHKYDICQFSLGVRKQFWGNTGSIDSSTSLTTMPISVGVSGEVEQSNESQAATTTGVKTSKDWMSLFLSGSSRLTFEMH